MAFAPLKLIQKEVIKKKGQQIMDNLNKLKGTLSLTSPTVSNVIKTIPSPKGTFTQEQVDSPFMKKWGQITNLKNQMNDSFLSEPKKKEYSLVSPETGQKQAEQSFEERVKEQGMKTAYGMTLAKKTISETIPSLLSNAIERESWIKSQLPPKARDVPYSELKRLDPEFMKTKEQEFVQFKKTQEEDLNVKKIKSITNFKNVPEFLLKKLNPETMKLGLAQYEKENKGKLESGQALPMMKEQEKIIQEGLEQEKLKGMDVLSKTAYKVEKATHKYVDPLVEGIVSGVTFTEITSKGIMDDPDNSIQAALRFAGSLAGSFLPYGVISKGIKVGIGGLAGLNMMKQSATAYKTLSTLDKLAKTNVLWKSALAEATIFNTLEETTDAIIRKGVLKQDYTFNDFMIGLLMGAGIGSTMQIGLHKLSTKSVKGQMEYANKVFTETKDFESVKSLPLGKSTFGQVFGEQRFAYLKGLEPEGRPGIEKAAPVEEISPELKPLYEEAKKYESAKEFTARMRGSATQYGEYTPQLRKFGTTEDDMRLSDLGISPEKEIMIYRGVPKENVKEQIVDGDFITTDYNSASVYSGGNVISKKVKIKDLITDSPEEIDIKNPFTEGAEFIYSDSKNKLTKLTKSQLTEIWNKANQKLPQTPLKTDDLAYMTGKKAGALGESLESPSKADFQKYQKQFSDLEFKNADDMKLIRDRATGTLIGVQNRAGERRTIGEALATQKILESPRKPAIPKQVSTVGKSKVGKSVAKKAVVARLIKTFSDTADYDKITLKDQAEKAVKLVDEDLEMARKILNGHAELPSNIRGVAIVSALEEYAIRTKNGELLQEISSSHLVSETSVHAQEMRLMAERAPESPVMAMQKIRQARANKILRQKENFAKKVYERTVKELDKELDNLLKNKEKAISKEASKVRILEIKKQQKEIKTSIKKAGKVKTIEGIKKIVARQLKVEIKGEIKRAAPKKEDWNSFVDSITC